MGRSHPHRGAGVEEPLTALSDPLVARRLLAAAALAQDSTHYLHGHLLTLVGFAELLREEETESGRQDGYGGVLMHAARRVQARIDALIYLLAVAGRPSPLSEPGALGRLVREVSHGQEVAIDCRVSDECPVAVDAQGLRCLLNSLLVIAEPSLALTVGLCAALHGSGEWLEVTCAVSAPSPAAPGPVEPHSVEQTTELAVIEALAAALGGSCVAHPAAEGRGGLRVVIPLPAPTESMSSEAQG
jgi:hypothetical protein